MVRGLQSLRCNCDLLQQGIESAIAVGEQPLRWQAELFFPRSNLPFMMRAYTKHRVKVIESRRPINHMAAYDRMMNVNVVPNLR